MTTGNYNSNFNPLSQILSNCT